MKNTVNIWAYRKRFFIIVPLKLPSDFMYDEYCACVYFAFIFVFAFQVTDDFVLEISLIQF